MSETNTLEPPAGRFADESASAPAAAAPARPAPPAGPSWYEALEAFSAPEHLKDHPKTPAINAAVANVLSEVRRVGKRGHNSFFHYDYATADDIREAVAELLGKHGLSYEVHEGGFRPVQANMVACVFWFRLVHKDGEVGPFEKRTALTLLTTRQGGLDDKCFSKAVVLATKDWAKIRFSMATGEADDDPDFDAGSPPGQQRNANDRQPAAPPNDPKREAGGRQDRLAANLASKPAGAGKDDKPAATGAKTDKQAAGAKREDKEPTAEQIEAAQRFVGNFLRMVDEARDPEDVVAYAMEDETRRGLGSLSRHFPEAWRNLLTGCAEQDRIEKMVGLQTDMASFYDAIMAQTAVPNEGVSLMITAGQKQELVMRGYTPEQIAEMTPARAHELLGVKKK